MVNTLSGPIPASLGGLTSLSSLVLSGNSLTGPIPPFLGLLPSITALGLSHNQLSGMIPPSFYNLSTLEKIGISDNQLTGTLPQDFGLNFPSLQILYLYLNQFHGSLPLSLANASGLVDIEVTGNSFSGRIPSNLGNLQGLFWLDLDRNEFEAGDVDGWSFLTSLTNCTNLQALSLDINRLGGVMPNSVANLSTKLEWLALGGNQISGSIPVEIGNLVNLTILGMDNNLLTGSIPASFGKIQNLQELFLFQNKLSGSIPASLGNLTQLNKLILADNLLEGSIPPSLGDCQHLRRLNLSHNQLSGTIPKEVVSISSLTEFLDLSHNSLTGSLPYEVGRLKNLVEIHVSDNNLIAGIPGSIGLCQELEILHMEGNLFDGKVPSAMSNLKGLQELDLSGNNLSGPIPEFLEGFNFLQYLNLSFNNFEGKVPIKGIFRNASAISVLGNNNLCGGSPKLGLPLCPIQTEEKKGSKRIKMVISVVIVSLFLILVICLFVIWYFLHRRGTKALRRDCVEDEQNQHIKVSYSNILKATDEFSSANLIGAGSFGSVYRGIMNFGQEKLVAVKVLNLQQKGASKSFMAECNALRSARHRNLLKILTSCSSVDYKGNDFKALVYEYMTNGSLEKWLHSQGEESEVTSLSLQQRLSTAIDVASALDYLHQYGPTPIVHCDLKPSNVLLDDDMTAHVGDFGLAKFLAKTSINSTGSAGIKGTIGYVAPEYGVANQVSTKGDVYSYGVLLLEMFTGKRPSDDHIMQTGLTLHKFVEMAHPDRVLDIIDPYLLYQEKDEELRVRTLECFVSVLRIGLLCSKESPRERMQMGDVIKEIHTVRDIFNGSGFREERRNKDQFKDEGPSHLGNS